jgi:tetratricopeptide (TPR) repeat protein/tRNA A-37 threonylcarbamoyl transferase component Bud32
VDVVECESCDELLVDIFASPATPSLTPSSKVVAGELATGSLLGDRYEILDLIGEGGMGCVYKVRDRELDKVIALKLIRSDQSQDPTVIQRFKQELLLARNVTHKNVIRLYDIGESNGFKFFTMELIDGENLKERIRREGALSVEESLPLIRQMIDALQEAHLQGVVHRDLKPQNVMMDGNGDPHIMDFGIARTVDTNTMTATGAVMGTPDYMSPEQAYGDKADQQSDLFSLGVICFEMLTGELPYQAESPLSRVVMRITKKPKTPRELGADLPVYLEKVVLKCMEMDKELRYQSAEEILHDLDEEQVDGAVGLRLRRAAGRRKGILVSAAALLIAVVALLNFVGRPPSPPAPAEEVPVKTLAILPFTNATASSELDWMRTGLPEMLFTDISQSKFVRPVLGERLVKLLRELGVEEMNRFDEVTLASISELAAVESVLYGQFVESDGSIRLDLFLRDAASGVPTPIRVQAKTDQVFTLVDDITTQIKEHLDLTPEQLKGDIDRPVVEVSTASLEALQAYQAGLAELRQGANQAAILFFEKAVTGDSQFAMAHAKLAEAYLKMGDYGPAEEAVDRAQALSETAPLPLAERYQVHAITALAKDDYETAVTSYRELTKLFPEDPDVHLNLAQSLEELGTMPEAIEAYETVVELAPGYGAAILGLGRSYVVSGRLDDAIQTLEGAIERKAFEGDLEALGLVYSILGVAHRDLGGLEKAAHNLNLSLEFRRKTENTRGQAVTLTHIAAVYRQRGDFDQALNAERQALSMAREIGDRAVESQALMNMGSTYKAAGRLDEALGVFRESMRIEQDRQDYVDLASSLGWIASIYRVQGHFDDALVYLEQAKGYLESSGDQQEKAAILEDIGGIKKSLGQYGEAVEALFAALPIYQTARYPVGATEVQLTLAEIYADQGRYVDAHAALKQSLGISQETELGQVSAKVVVHWGQFLMTMGQVNAAEKQIEHAERILTLSQGDNLSALMELCRGRLAHLRGMEAGAAEAYRSADIKASRGGQLELSIRSRIELGAAIGRQGNFAEAEKLLLEARQEASGSRLLVLETAAVSGLAGLYLAKGDEEAAYTSAREVIGMAERFSGQPLLLKGYAVQGQALEKLDKAEEALDSYSKVVASLQWIASNLTEEYVDSYMLGPDVQMILGKAAGSLGRAGRSEAGFLEKWVQMNLDHSAQKRRADVNLR